MDAVSGSSPWNIVTPKTISRAIKNITIAPATAKEFISIPIKFNISSPKKRKPIIINIATIVAFSDSILPTFSFRDITIGVAPTISITAKSIILAVKTSLKSNINTNN